MNVLLSRFKIEDDYLINHQNQRFPRIAYKSDLHSDLAFKLQDAVLAETIHSAYAEHIADTLTDPEKNLFANALLRVCYLFGCPEYPPSLGLRRSLVQENFSFDTWMETHHRAFQLFMEQANQARFPAREPKRHDRLTHIVITTTSAAGGNFSVAEGLASELRKQFRVTVIDVEEISKEIDPMMIATGTHTFDQVYAEFVQQENRLDQGFELRLNVYRQIARYIEPILGQKLKETILELDPDFIVSTRSCDPLDLSLAASVRTPLSIHHCDYEIGYFFHELIEKIQPQLVKLWLPDSQPSVFKPILDRTGISLEEHQNLNWPDFRHVLADAVKVPVSDIDERVEFVGLPARQEIHLIKGDAEIERLKAQWGLQPGEACIPVSMGRNGVGQMREVFDELLKSPIHQIPIKYIFVCGTNESMQADFTQKLSETDLSNSALHHCSITGLISGTEFNELLNIGTLLLGKPGGAQTAESMKDRIPMLITFMHEYWESGNMARLAKENYVLSFSLEKPLAAQIEEHVLNLKNAKPHKVIRLKWKKLIPKAIHNALNS